MHDRDDPTAPKTDKPDLELKLLVLADTLLALTSLARIELKRSVVAGPKWVLLSLARLPMWLLFWLSLSALLSYLAYAFSGSVGIGLTALVLLQGGVCLLIETGLRSLWREMTFTETREALKECADTMAFAQTKKFVKDQPNEFH